MNPELNPAPDDTELPLDVCRTLGSYFGDALDLFQELEPFASFDAISWAVFVALANSWRRTGASPRARELAAACRWSRRSVFRCLGVLQDKGIVRSVGALNNGRYVVGSALGPILRTFAGDRDPALWPYVAVQRPLDPGAPVARDPVESAPQALPTPAGPAPLRTALAPFLVCPPAVAPIECPAGTRSDPSSEASTPPLIKNKKDLRSSSSEPEQPQRTVQAPVPPRLTPPAPGDTRPSDPTTPRRIACAALAALHRQTYPEIPPPRTFHPGDVGIVERCGAQGAWDPVTLEQMHLDAIQSACRTSSGPPRPAYVWGQFHHFLEHVRKGRAQRERDQPRLPPKPKKPPEPEEPTASPRWVAEHLAEVRRPLGW